MRDLCGYESVLYLALINVNILIVGYCAIVLKDITFEWNWVKSIVLFLTTACELSQNKQFNYKKWSKKISNCFTQALHKPYSRIWDTAEDIYRIKESLNKCMYDRFPKAFYDPWGSSLIPGRAAMSPVTLCEILSIVRPEIKETIGQSWRASLCFLCWRKIWKELRDRCEGGQSQLRSHPLQESSAQLPKLGIPFHLLH